MDNLTKEQRRKNMRAIRSKDTKIEVRLRKELWKRGYRYRIHYKNLSGKPDIVFTKQKIAVFCDSEFFHGFNWEEQHEKIKSNREYWISEKGLDYPINWMFRELVGFLILQSFQLVFENVGGFTIFYGGKLTEELKNIKMKVAL